MPKLSDATLAERRGHILRAAAQCFARNGLRGTTLDDVKREAGVSTGAIYTYFQSKEAMMGALLEVARAGRKKRIERALLSGGGAAEPVRLLLNWATAAAGPKGKHAARIDVHLWAEALSTPSMGELARSAIDDAVRGVGHVVRAQLQRRRTTKGVDAEAVASLVIALYIGLEVQSAVGVNLDVDGIARVLDTLCADFLPSDTKSGDGPPSRARRQRRAETR